MKTKILSYILILLMGFFLINCEKNSNDGIPDFSLQQPDLLADEEYEIYSIIINELFSSEVIVIKQTSLAYLQIYHPDQFNDYLIQNHPNFDNEIIARLNVLNESSVLFDEKFTSELKEIKLISSEEFLYIFNGKDINKNWEKFYEKYENSNGTLEFSRIAYNDTKSQALLALGNAYASLGGNGELIYLEKENDNWIIKEVIPTWIS